MRVCYILREEILLVVVRYLEAGVESIEGGNKAGGKKHHLKVNTAPKENGN